MFVLGIDPGSTGAVAVVDHHGIAQVADIPTQRIQSRTTRGRIVRMVDARGLFDLIARMVPADEVAVAFLEDVQPLPRHLSSQSSNGSLMRCKGSIEAVLALHRSRVSEVLWIPPRSWRAALQLVKVKGQDTKPDSLRLARRLYPDASLSRQRDHNRAEALLLAHYGRALLA